MSSIGILTDSAAQFPQLGFSGKNDIHILPFSVEINGIRYEEGRDLRVADLPVTASEATRPRLLAPSPARFQEVFTSLGQTYRDVIAIFSSAALTQSCENALKAVAATRGRVNVILIDSMAVSVGLGLLVQTAAEAVAEGQSAADVERLVRSLIPRTYMMICTPGMSYLHHAGILDPSQAFVGEMIGLMPIFTLEEGQFSPAEKVRNTRALLDYMQEFMSEFDQLKHIALLQGVPSITHEVRVLREHAQTLFPTTPFSELNISLPLATLAGPHSLGLVLMETGD